MAAEQPIGPELPVACTLGAPDLRERRLEWEALLSGALLRIARTPEGVVLDLRNQPDGEREVRRLALLEAECCAFASWQVRADGDGLSLEVTAEPDAVPAVHAMFGRA